MDVAEQPAHLPRFVIVVNVQSPRLGRVAADRAAATLRRQERVVLGERKPGAALVGGGYGNRPCVKAYPRHEYGRRAASYMPLSIAPGKPAINRSRMTE